MLLHLNAGSNFRVIEYFVNVPKAYCMISDTSHFMREDLEDNAFGR